MIAAVAAALSVVALPAGAIPPGTQVPLGEPRYTVEVHGFRAIDESGADWNGSDEVFGIFKSTRGHWVRTSEYGDVDSGEFRRIASGERCLAPQHVLSGNLTLGWLWAPYDSWDCRPSRGGVAGPIGLRLELWEDDDCNPFLPSCFNPYSPEVRDPADDLIGRAEVTYSRGQLASRLPHVGDVMVDKFTLGGPCGHQEPDHVCGAGPLSATGPEYELTINIRRASDAPLHATQ